MSINTPDFQKEIHEVIEEKTTEPPMYKVLLHNDDYTTKDFVVEILMAIFNKSRQESTSLMWHIHRNGSGICGIYPYEMAETKVNLVTLVARENGFPLKTSIERE